MKPTSNPVPPVAVSNDAREDGAILVTGARGPGPGARPDAASSTVSPRPVASCAPSAGSPEPFVDLDDLAVAGLLGHLRDGVHELTGPTALTMHEVAAVLSAATGRSVTYQPVTRTEFHDDLLALGLPVEVAEGIAGLFTELFDGRNVQPTDGVRAALGREPRPFATAMRDAHTTPTGTR